MNSGTESREQRKQKKHGSEQWRLKGGLGFCKHSFAAAVKEGRAGVVFDKCKNIPPKCDIYVIFVV